MLALGAEDNPGMFNMAHMGLRLAQRANGVSALHGRVSRTMFGRLWPGFDTSEVPIGSVTNGVHGPTWAAREISSLLRASPNRASNRRTTRCCWELRCGLRRRLVMRCGGGCARPGCSAAPSALELGWADSVFDPDVLTVGFARRVPTYKRLTLMLRDPERLKVLLLR